MQPSGGSQVKPGRTATFSIVVWTTEATSKDTAATIKVQPAAHLGSPTFTICPSASGATCSLGNLRVDQADDLQASVTVGSQAAPGEHVELIADANATGAAPVGSSATVLVARRAVPSPSPSTGATAPAAPPLPPAFYLPSVYLPSVTLPARPEAGITATDVAGLFPTVSPSLGNSAGLPFPSVLSFLGLTAQPRRSASRVSLVTAAVILPRGPQLIGVELAGLAVLAAAAAMAMSRLSRRMQRRRMQRQP